MSVLEVFSVCVCVYTKSKHALGNVLQIETIGINCHQMTIAKTPYMESKRGSVVKIWQYHVITWIQAPHWLRELETGNSLHNLLNNTRKEGTMTANLTLFWDKMAVKTSEKVVINHIWGSSCKLNMKYNRMQQKWLKNKGWSQMRMTVNMEFTVNTRQHKEFIVMCTSKHTVCVEKVQIVNFF